MKQGMKYILIILGILLLAITGFGVYYFTHVFYVPDKGGMTDTSYIIEFDQTAFSGPTHAYQGEEVEVVLTMIATDTNYDFDVNTEYDVYYDDSRGYVIAFDMPSHNVTIMYESHNSMENEE